jgi:hypothetical protein
MTAMNSATFNFLEFDDVIDLCLWGSPSSEDEIQWFAPHCGVTGSPDSSEPNPLDPLRLDLALESTTT